MDTLSWSDDCFFCEGVLDQLQQGLRQRKTWDVMERVWSEECRAWGAEYRAWSAESGMQYLEYRVQRLEYRVQRLEYRVQSLGCRVQSLECRMQRLMLLLGSKRRTLMDMPQFIVHICFDCNLKKNF